MTEALVLSEDEALDLAAFMVSAARLLLEEPVDYGPMRLLAAAQRLAAAAAPRSGADRRALFERLAAEIPPNVALRNRDPARFAAFLDEAERAIARVVMRRRGAP